MKIRNGFVSNSSSSSFIMMIPKSFNIDEFDLSPHQPVLDENDLEEEEFRNVFKKLQSKGYLWRDSNYYSYDAIMEIFEDFIITSIESGPDDGTIQLLSDKDIEKIKKLLSI